MKPNWGTSVIPKEQWIDVNKTYVCKGNPVVDLKIELYNSNGDEVTYPVKGTIILRDKPRKIKYTTWSLDGRADVVWNTGNNLIEMTK